MIWVSVLAALVAAAPAELVAEDALLAKRQATTIYAQKCTTIYNVLLPAIVLSSTCNFDSTAGPNYVQSCYALLADLALFSGCNAASTAVSSCSVSFRTFTTSTTPFLQAPTTFVTSTPVSTVCVTPTYPARPASTIAKATTSSVVISSSLTTASAAAVPTTAMRSTTTSPTSSTANVVSTSSTLVVALTSSSAGVTSTSSTSSLLTSTSSTSVAAQVTSSSSTRPTTTSTSSTSLVQSSSSAVLSSSSAPLVVSTSSIAPGSLMSSTAAQIVSSSFIRSSTTSSSPLAVTSMAPSLTAGPSSSLASTSNLVTLTSSVPSSTRVLPTSSSSRVASSSSSASASPTAGLPRTAKNGATYIGCFQDYVDQRTLSQRVNDVNNVEECVTQCANAGFDRAGVEYYTQCFCGYASAGYNGQPQISDDTCSVPCNDATQTCGNGNAIQIYAIPPGLVNTVPATSTATPTASPTAGLPRQSRNGGKYLGCYKDDVNQRALPVRLQDVGTVEACITQCQSAGYSLAGLEYYYQCFCGNSGTNGQPRIDDGQCNTPCNDDKSETCGGSNALQLYSVPQSAGSPTIPTTVTTSSGSGSFQGCYNDNVNYRTLPNRVADAGSVDQCVSSCINAGYSYAGIEYTRECYCGNTVTASLIDNSQCQKYTCTENGSQKCGGDSAIQVYSLQSSNPPPAATGTWSNVGCLQDFYPDTRILQGYSFTSNSMTPQLCKSTCQAKGFIYAGVEYAGECYCDNQIRNNPKSVSSCTMACSGDSAQLCGGSNAIQVFTLATVPSGTGSSDASSAAPVAAAATIVQKTSDGATYKGCYTDNVNARALRNRLSDVTGSDPISACMTACRSAGYSLGGVEYGHECFCDNGIYNANTVTGDSACSQICDGNSSQYCGNGNIVQMYTL